METARVTGSDEVEFQLQSIRINFSIPSITVPITRTSKYQHWFETEKSK